MASSIWNHEGKHIMTTSTEMLKMWGLEHEKAIRVGKISHLATIPRKVGVINDSTAMSMARALTPKDQPQLIPQPDLETAIIRTALREIKQFLLDNVKNNPDATFYIQNIYVSRTMMFQYYRQAPDYDPYMYSISLDFYSVGKPSFTARF